MDYILLYSLSLLFYQTLYTAEQHRLRHYLTQLAQSTSLDIDNPLHNGPNRRAVAH